MAKKEKDKKEAHAPAAEAAPPAEGAEGAAPELPPKKGPPIKLILMIAIPILLLALIGGGLAISGVLSPKKTDDQETTDSKDKDKKDDKHKKDDKSDDHKEDKKDEKSKPDKKEDKKDDHKSEKKDGHGDKDGKEAGPVYFDLQDILVNLDARSGRRATVLKLGITLEIDSAEDKKTLEGLLPRVMDQFQTFLRELRVEDLRGSAGIYRLRQELLARIRPAVEPIEVKDVLFREFLIQ